MEENPRALGNYSINVMVDEKTSVTVQLHVSKEPMDPKSLDLLARKQRAAAAAATQL
jgi:hypothetical protein